jgi:DMSO/TMAO reductase YedYZ molybdopterin-dependent catalytic subunit
MTTAVPTAELNLETPLPAMEHGITPPGLFFRRTNFFIPAIDPATWVLPVRGEADAPFAISLDELRSLPRHTVAATMECAGNGRSLLSPLPPGQPWGLGAASTAVFTGVPLAVLLDRVRPRASAVEVLFTGADAGSVGPGRSEPFARSMPLADARDPDVLLAWEMDGAPLSPEHGFPLRLVVPRWYGVASVKWLAEVRLLAEPFQGHFQAERYVYLGEAGTPDGTPVRRKRVRAVVARPAGGEVLAAGVPVELRGSAWSGDAPVRSVEVSTDGGATWAAASLDTVASPYAAVPWRLRWTPARSGPAEIVARATDAAGNTQPLGPVWNELGYGNNGVHRVPVRVA